MPFWDIRAEMTAHSPTWLDLPITLLECGLGGVLARDL
jgi:hypothetical protein